jgi:hypothetical protein
MAEFQAVVLALKAAPKEIRSRISRETRETLNPIWREEIANHAGLSRRDNLVFGKGARVAAGNPAVAMAATSKRALRDGSSPFIPDELGRSLEFGAYDRGRPSTYTRKSRKGNTHSVTRKTRTGLPPQNRRGRVVYPAFAEAAPRMLSLWVQTVARVVHEAFEGK